jgi:hypothetical protein
MTERESGSDEGRPLLPESISGEARNARAGAVLLADDGRELYVRGLDEWDEDVLGTRLTLTGVARREGFYPEAGVDESGQLVQGMVGIPLVLELTEPVQKAE